MKNCIIALALLAAAMAASAGPAFTQQPANQVVNVGGTAVFNVSVSGIGPFSCQWLFNGINFTNITLTNVITTVAGSGLAGYSGDGGMATNASLRGPVGVTVDASGNIFIGDAQNSRIRKVDTNGIITTVAGGGSNYPGDGGAATNASLLYADDVTFDTFGNFYIVDAQHHRIRKVDANGIITTVAGNGTGSYAGDGGPATNASLNFPDGLVFDSAGNMFIADWGNNRIRKVDTNGIITTIAGIGPTYPSPGGYSGDGGAATNANLNGPVDVMLDNSSNLLFADSKNNRVRRISTNGIITTIAGGGTGGLGDGGTATNANLNTPNGVLVDAFGDLFIGDSGNNRIRLVSTNGIITTFAGGGASGLGDGGVATNATISGPQWVAIDGSGNLFIADNGNNRIRKVNLGGSPTLTLNNVTTNNAGNYQVIVTSPYGSITSRVATLTVPYIQITQQPTNQLVLPGASAVFNVAVSGTGPFTYQWLFNSNSINNAAAIGIITTIAGNGQAGYSGDGGAATNASLRGPVGVTGDAAGNIFIGDAQNSRIRKVDTNGIITTVAGGGSNYPGDGGAATNASLLYSDYVAFDISSNLYIVDAQHHRIRKVNTNGIITTVAGNGTGSYAGDGGPATNASLNFPDGLVFDSAGNMFIADWGNNRIRKVDTNGIITTIAGIGPTYPSPAGFSGDGGAATNASLNGPVFVILDASGNLLFGDSKNNRVRKVSINGIITTVAGGGTGGLGDGGAATNASLNTPNGVALDASGNLFIGDSLNNRIREVSNNGIITTVVGGGAGGLGDGGAATNAALSTPEEVAFDRAGNLLIADYGNSRIRKVAVSFSGAPTLTLNNVTTNNAGSYQVIITSPYGSITSSVATLTVPNFQITQQPTNQSVATGGAPAFSIAVSGTGPFTYQWLFNGNMIANNGIITTVAGNGSPGYSGDGNAATNASLQYPYGAALDAFGNLFIAEYGNNRVRKVDTNGVITTVAGNGTANYSGDGGAATNASLNAPTGVAVDAYGNMLIADYHNNRVRKVSANGIITTMVGNGVGTFAGDGGAATNASLNTPGSIAMDAAGNLFITDNSNNRIRKEGTNGIITTVAGKGTVGYSGDGGAATNASFSDPTFVAVDGSGNLFIADYYNNRIRKVNTNGIITTVAGNGSGGYSGDGGAATNANLNLPESLAFDASGNLLICDGNNRVRKVDANGIITTVAGNGSGGYSGDGGAATNASLDAPAGVAVDTNGNLFISDLINNRIREVRFGGSPVLTLANVTTNNAGSYQVIVTGPYGSITSSVAMLTVAPPRTATATAIVAYGFLVATTNLDGGSGYIQPPIVRIIGGGGSGATATAVVSNGVVIGIIITANGSGYTNTPLVVIEPPSVPSPVLKIAPMTYLSFSNLTIGGNYQLQNLARWYWTNQPVNFTATNSVFTQMVPGVAGSGSYRLALNPVPSQAFATAQVVSGSVIGATVTAGGSGYFTSPFVTITGGGGTNATAVSFVSGGAVIGIGITADGAGYTNKPTIQIAPPPAAAVSPTVQPVMRVDAANLAPYDNYQVQFMPDINSAWVNWNNGSFSPTGATNSQFLFVTNGTGFFRLQYMGTP